MEKFIVSSYFDFYSSVYIEKEDDENKFRPVICDGYKFFLENMKDTIVVDNDYIYVPSNREHSMNIYPYKRIRRDGNVIFMFDNVKMINPKFEIIDGNSSDCYKFVYVGKKGMIYDFCIYKGKFMISSKMLSSVISTGISGILKAGLTFILKDVSSDGNFFVPAKECFLNRLINPAALIFIHGIRKEIKSIYGK